ncbi:MAG: hypothetical protein LC640_12870 [Frankia sp.]|nr:hypothetical protein [Frankia sp.]
MTRTRWAPRSLTAAVGALATAFAVAVPLAGTAFADHDNVTSVTLAPDTDTAAVGTCNAFVVTTTGPETQSRHFEVLITQTGTAGLIIGFCDPGAASSAQPNPQAAPDTVTAPTGNVAAGTAPGPASSGCTANPQPTGTSTALVTCHGDYDSTTATGTTQRSTIGVYSNQAGTMNITAFSENVQAAGNTAVANDMPDPSEPQDTSVKTWVTGGQAGITRVDCEPETKSNPEDTTHAFTCTAFGGTQGTIPLGNVQLSFDVIAGPNAAEVGSQPCTGGTLAAPNVGGPAVVTDNNGQVVCAYDDNTISGASTATEVDSPPGTDTIVGYAEQTPPIGTPGGPGAQSFEPQDQILKTWTGLARFIVCSPANATNPAGTQHVVTCTVTDVAGNPVPGQVVVFTENGPGAIVSPTTTIDPAGGSDPAFSGQPYGVTNAQGQVQVRTQTAQNETGTESITGELAQGCTPNILNIQFGCQRATVTPATEECQQPAGTTNDTGTGAEGTAPAGSPGANTAGNCTATVTKVWFTGTSPTATATATSTATATATATATTTATTTATSTATSTPPPSACVGATQASVTISIAPSLILAGQASTVRVTAPVGSTVELLARISGATYTAVRTATVPVGGTIDFLVTPRYTTRVAARACGFTSLAQPIISVAGRVSLAVSSLPGCVLRFSGGTLPVKPGQVVNVYYRSGGAITLAIQARTSSTGTYVTQRRFLACGRTFSFFARTNGDVNNLPGQSPDRVATIRR